MAVSLLWSQQAEDDLQAIFDYISSDNIEAAQRYAETVVAACERLRDFPLSGREYEERYRVLVVRNHLVFYRYEQQDAEVLIVAVLDGRRDIAALLRALGEG